MEIMKDEGEFRDLNEHCQLCGILYKKPFQHQSNKWAKRFFILKEGMLFYYPDSERKEFDKRRYFNIHPKGVVPLGKALIEAVDDSSHPFSIHIQSTEVTGNIVVAAENEFEREKWLLGLRQSSHVTFQNIQQSVSLINSLESQGLQMAEEKQQFFNQLINESRELHDEKQKTEELERDKEELERFNTELERFNTELERENEELERDKREKSEEYNVMRERIAQNENAVKLIEQEKQQLRKEADTFQKSLLNLEKEGSDIRNRLKCRQTEAEQLTAEKKSLSHEIEQLTKKLKSIENESENVYAEKQNTERKLEIRERKSMILTSEQSEFTCQATKLQADFMDLTSKKELVDAELKQCKILVKEEVSARQEMEKKLRETENSLRRLDEAVNRKPDDGGSTQSRSEEQLKEMRGDVKTIKQFFENLAFESKLEADKSVMIRNALQTRHSYIRRAKTLRIQTNKKHRPTVCPTLYFDGDSSQMSQKLTALLRKPRAPQVQADAGEPERRHAVVKHSSLLVTLPRLFDDPETA